MRSCSDLHAQCLRHPQRCGVAGKSFGWLRGHGSGGASLIIVPHTFVRNSQWQCLLRESPPGSTGANHSNLSENGHNGRPNFTPLLSHAYANRPHCDPLSSPDEIDSSNGDLGESGLHPVQSVIVQETLSPRFHGESSLLAFTNGLSEKWKFTSRHDLRGHRREFWETPEVLFKLIVGSVRLIIFPSGC